MRHKIYVETSIPSFYFESRHQPEVVARREWTRRWWANAQTKEELVTSPAVIEELSRGDYPKQADCLGLVNQLPLLDIDDATTEIAATYVARSLMPRDYMGDALHLAVASYHQCHFLATWNCRHLANANKMDHVRRLNAMLGLYVPLLVTPLELLGEDDAER